MAKSLAKIKEQIAKLQKEADAIQSTVIARLKREIAQHGLTAEHLFSSAKSTSIGNASRPEVKAAKADTAKKASAAKPAKYADDQGNAWHGVGKRPKWIHAALNAGQSLEEFLVGAKKAPATKAANGLAKVTSKAAKKTSRKTSPAKKATRVAPSAKAVARAPAKTARKPVVVAKKAPAKKPAKVKGATPSTDAAAASV